MRFPGDTRGWWLGAASALVAAAVVACSLNPQPLPPETFDDGGANGGSGTDGPGFGSDSGSAADGATIGSDAAAPPADGAAGVDSGGDAAEKNDGGDGGFDDGATEAGDAAATDAPTEGG